MKLIKKSIEMIPGLIKAANVKESEKMILIRYIIPNNTKSYYITRYNREGKTLHGYEVINLKKTKNTTFKLEILEAIIGIKLDTSFKPRKYKYIPELQ